jgi:hypothetical protein
MTGYLFHVISGAAVDRNKTMSEIKSVTQGLNYILRSNGSCNTRNKGNIQEGQR